MTAMFITCFERWRVQACGAERSGGDQITAELINKVRRDHF